MTKDKQNFFDLVEKHGSEKRVTCFTEKSTRFTISLNPNKLQESIHSIGSIELSEVPSTVIFVPQKKRQSQMPIVQPQNLPFFVHKRDLDLKSALVFGLTVNQNDEVILVDSSERGGLLVYDDNHNYQYLINTEHQHWDIDLIPGKNIGVLTSYKEEVLHFVDFDKKTISRTVSVKKSKQGGVAASNKNIYVGTKGNINILDLDGRCIRLIKTKDETRTPWFISLDKTGNIYYTIQKLLGCITSDGAEVYTYSTTDNDTLWKLAVDNNGYVYVAIQSKGICRLKPDGTFMDIVIKDERSPCFVGFSFNIKFTQMILSRCSFVSVFNLK